jgi:hypothetical protein
LAAFTNYTFTVTATNSAGTSAASGASNSITSSAAIGSAFGGGYFAGQISTAGNGVADFNLVVGPRSSAQATNKSYKTTDTTTSGVDSVIAGPTNSANMNSASFPAAQFCEGLSIGGFSDWYMPAKNELEVCYYNLKPTGGANNTSSGTNTNAVPSRGSNYTAGNPAQTSAAAFQSGGGEDYAGVQYWSSTQTTPTGSSAWFQYFSNGRQVSYRSVINAHYVRAVRRVAV